MHIICAYWGDFKTNSWTFVSTTKVRNSQRKLIFSFPVRALSSGTKTSRAEKLHMRSEQCQPPKLNLKTHGPNVLLALVWVRVSSQHLIWGFQLVLVSVWNFLVKCSVRYFGTSEHFGSLLHNLRLWPSPSHGDNCAVLKHFCVTVAFSPTLRTSPGWQRCVYLLF